VKVPQPDLVSDLVTAASTAPPGDSAAEIVDRVHAAAPADTDVGAGAETDAHADGRAAAAATEHPQWIEISTAAGLAPWAGAIDALVQRERLPALASWAWLSSFWEGFFAGMREVSLHLCHRDGQVLAAIPVRRSGRLVRKVIGLENEHFVYWSTAVDSSYPQLGALLLDRLLAGAECFELRRLPLDGPLCQQLEEAARRQGLPVVLHPNAEGEVAIPLQSPFAAFEKTISKNLRRDGRLVSKLEALGAVTFEVVEGEPRLTPELAACFELEAMGWKGASGSPVVADPQTHHFYRTLAQRAAATGRLRLFLLKLDGRLIAFEYDLCGGGRVECLKIGYDESLARFSPGTILRMMLLKRVIERGEATSYHLGRESAWKRRWVKDVDRIGTLQIFAGTRRGRVAHVGGPLLRRVLKRLPGAKPLMDFIHREHDDEEKPGTKEPPQ
jgi:CelD/BcsL family acetyltransferase involved in cellulose biosynthesis